MNTFIAFAIIAAAGLIHATFQLSISMLTLLSSHTIGRKQSQKRLSLLSHSFVLGSGVMTILLICLFAQLLHFVTGSLPSDLIWTVICGTMFGLAIGILLFYYRKETGTMLWIPREMARYLSRRARATKHSAEAFSLGLTSIVCELLFIAAPLTVAALVLLQLSPVLQLAGIILYTLTSLSSLVIFHVLIGSGHSISRLQRWREQNKGFLQFASAGGLLVLGFYLYVEQVLTIAVWAAEKAAW